MKQKATTRVMKGAFLGVFFFLFAMNNAYGNENENGNGDEGGYPYPELLNTNGSFEDTELGPVEDLEGVPGWILEIGGSADVDFEIVDDIVKDGDKALRVFINTLGSDAWHVQVIGDDIPVVPGADYELSVWLRAEGSGATAHVTAGNYDFNEYGRMHGESIGNGEWQEHVLNFSIGDNETRARMPVHFNMSGNLEVPIYVDNMKVRLIEDAEERRMPIIVDAASGVIGADFDLQEETGPDGAFEYVRVTTDAHDDGLDSWSYPMNEDRIISYEVLFPFAGEYNLFLRGRTSSADDDSFFYPVGFGEKDVTNADDWIIANQLDAGGYREVTDVVVERGAEGNDVWKWLNISEGNFHEDGITYTIEEDSSVVTFVIGGRESNFDIDKLAFGRTDLYFMVMDLDQGSAGTAHFPEDPVPDPEGPPLADGRSKFLGNIWAPTQVRHFEHYWNQVTPENATKWGSIESARGERNWSQADDAYNFAKDNGWPFRFHVLVWGNQQPSWMPDLVDQPEEQLAAVRDWFEAVAERYPDIDYLEVVNEPLHDPPDEDPENSGAGNYIEALGGTGETGWDWVITSFEMAREIFPESTKLMINEYGILGSVRNAERYLEIVHLLQERDLIDAIGVQGHAFSTRGSPNDILRVVNLLAETGLPIQVTEMDVDGNPGQSPNLSMEDSDRNQLNTLSRVFPVLWEHPSVMGITMWGWRPGLWRQSQEAYLVRNNGAERPAMVWLKEYMEDYVTSIEEQQPEKPASFSLSQNYPNPFNPVTRINYEVPDYANVTLNVYDITGRLVRTLVNNSSQAPGQYTVTFDGQNFASGVYIYRLQAGSHTAVKRMMLIK